MHPTIIKRALRLLLTFVLFAQTSALAYPIDDLGSYNIAGMPREHYEAAHGAQWSRVSPAYLLPTVHTAPAFDLEKRYRYADIEVILRQLAARDDAALYCIGYSAQGRMLYSLELGSGSKHILLTGGTHAREFAGTTFILKMLCDLAQASQTDKAVAKMLREYKIVALPCLNPDGREGILDREYPSDAKYNAARVDLNRSFPSVNAGQIIHGATAGETDYASVPGNFYPGSFLGQESETHAAIRWIEHYVAGRQAVYHLDLHQQGRRVYRSKTWDEPSRKRRTEQFSEKLQTLLHYRPIAEEPELHGEGGSFTDYVTSIAAGCLYSAANGRLGFPAQGELLPLIAFHKLPEKRYLPVNRTVASVTVEIGGRDSLGYGEYARKMAAFEYYAHNFDKLLTYLMQPQ